MSGYVFCSEFWSRYLTKPLFPKPKPIFYLYKIKTQRNTSEICDNWCDFISYTSRQNKTKRTSTKTNSKNFIHILLTSNISFSWSLPSRKPARVVLKLNKELKLYLCSEKSSQTWSEILHKHRIHKAFR